MWTVYVGVFARDLNRFLPERVIMRAPTYQECLSTVRKYGLWHKDYEIIHIVGCPARVDRCVHILTGDSLKHGRGAFIL